MPTYGSKWPIYAKQWDEMKIRENKRPVFEKIARKLIGFKSHYVAAEKLTGVPWYMIALLHMRESDNDFRTQLAQGDPLNRKSTHVPRGRGPFKTWEDGAYDALVTLKGFNKIIDWRLEKILYYAELYNGWGYYNHGVPSAYLWAGSTVYSGGKYVADGVWSASAVDSQPGVASVLRVMMELDSSIKPKRESTDAGATAVVVGGAGAAVTVAATTIIQPWMYWVAGVAIAAGLTWLVVRWYKKRTIKMNDVNQEHLHEPFVTASSLAARKDEANKKEQKNVDMDKGPVE